MKRKYYLQYSILLFIILQLTCFSLFGFWIFWFVTNDAIYTNLANLIHPDLLIRDRGIDLFIIGLILIFFIWVGLILIFIWLIRQIIVIKTHDGFIANVTHEFKSPLASIQLGIETLQQRVPTKQENDEILSRIARDTQRLNKLIESILEISILDSKGDFFQPIALPADVLVKNLVTELQNQFRLPENSISIEGITDCLINIDPAGLTTVFKNLIDNSMKYSTDPVEIKIRLESSRKKFIIILSDNGLGILEKDRKTVFKKFNRLKRPDNPSVRGTGIGLYWSREILKIHKGKIVLQNPAGNKGTCFRIEIPAVRKQRYVKSGGFQ